MSDSEEDLYISSFKDSQSEGSPPSAVKAMKLVSDDDGSSSESDMEKYAAKPGDIQKLTKFEDIESKILEGVKEINNDSDSSMSSNDDLPLKIYTKEGNEDDKVQYNNFSQFFEFTKNIEAAKEFLAKAKQEPERPKRQVTKNIKNDIDNIEELLAAGEAGVEKGIADGTFHVSDFETDEDEEWVPVAEEKKAAEEDRKGLEIVIEMPNTVKEKKPVDLLAALKRRLNRIRKENQVLVHKVHLLTWIAHGNYLNSILNEPTVLCSALSLLPSKDSYPPKRADIDYLEKIVKWYSKFMVIKEDVKLKSNKLDEMLLEQMEMKNCSNYKMFVYIFICLLRALGLKCRLVLNLRVEPLRPPQHELHSLSTKDVAEGKSEEKPASTKSKSVSKKSLPDIKMDADTNVDIDKSQKKKEKKIDTKTTKSKPNPVVKLTLLNTSVKIDEKKLEGKLKKSKKPAATLSKKTEEPSKNPRKTRSATKTSEVSKAPKLNVSKSNVNEKRLGAKLKAKSKVKKVEEVPDGGSNEEEEKSEVNENKMKVEKKKKGNAKSLINKKKTDEEASPTKLLTEIDSKLELLEKLESGQSTSYTVKKPALKKLKRKIAQVDGVDDDDSGPSTSKTPKISRVNFQRLKSPNNSLSSSSGVFSKSGNSSASIVENLVKESMKREKTETKIRKAKSRARVYKEAFSDSDDEVYTFPKARKSTSTPVKVKKRVLPKKELQKLEQEKKEKKKKEAVEINSKGVDVWVEVLLEAEERWISADVIKGTVHCVQEIYSRTSHPVSYIFSWDNSKRIKDITKRYTPNWNTVTRKLRAEQSWIDKTLKPFLGKRDRFDREEDEDLARQQLDQPLPQSIAEYKNHPLYVLQRHLLKFEAIYPPDAPTLGFVKGEPVYARGCVFVLHSREMWFKEAKVVSQGETPYKIVKARPKWDKYTKSVIKDLPLELFGHWQIEDYVPPAAENGKVPRNEYGNVELFKECMLPKGCAHLQYKLKKTTTTSTQILKEQSTNASPTRNLRKRKIVQVDGANDACSPSPTKKRKVAEITKSTRTTRSRSNLKPTDADTSNVLGSSGYHSANNESNSLLGTTTRKRKRRSVPQMIESSSEDVDEVDSGDEFVPSSLSKIRKSTSTPKIKRSRSAGKSPNVRKSSESDTNETNGFDVWVEVLINDKWICIDLQESNVNCVDDVLCRASHPITYILSWDNKNRLKDITKRYVTDFNTKIRKLRADSKWFTNTIKPFMGKIDSVDLKETAEMEKRQSEQPLPVALKDYKNHPLYALQRHLLKFEVLYPPEPPILGYVKGEAVYPRECVYVCQWREAWFKQAKVVKLGEEPYKIVTTLKWDKYAKKILKDQPLEIFGPWQVEDYVPPTAENGLVPRNEYGNVEIFKECMLPKKTVYLKLPNLNKVAKKLNIDCAPAVVGFEFNRGYNCPVFEGYVVCEEFKDTLIKAWEEDQKLMAQRQKEKREKRIWDNWRRLIKAAIIREKLKFKYGFGIKDGDLPEKPPTPPPNVKPVKKPRFIGKKK